MDVLTYINQYQTEVKNRLLAIREQILIICPTVIEQMAYGLPAYHYRGKPLIYYGAFKAHIGIYATPAVHGSDELYQEMWGYKQGKGSIQFSNYQPFPIELIKKMIRLKKEQLDKK